MYLYKRGGVYWIEYWNGGKRYRPPDCDGLGVLDHAGEHGFEELVGVLRNEHIVGNPPRLEPLYELAPGVAGMLRAYPFAVAVVINFRLLPP